MSKGQTINMQDNEKLTKYHTVFKYQNRRKGQNR